MLKQKGAIFQAEDRLEGVEGEALAARVEPVAIHLDVWGLSVSALKQGDEKEWELLRVQVSKAIERTASKYQSGQRTHLKDDVLGKGLIKLLDLLRKMPRTQQIEAAEDVLDFTLAEQSRLTNIYDFGSPFYPFARRLAHNELVTAVRTETRHRNRMMDLDDVETAKTDQEPLIAAIEDPEEAYQVAQQQFKATLERLLSMIQNELTPKPRQVVLHSLAMRPQFWRAVAEVNASLPPDFPTPRLDGDDNSLAFQYLGLDVILAGGPQAEETLSVYHWDGLTWQRLDTVVNKVQNFASALLLEPGLYMLAVGDVQFNELELSPTTAIAGQSHSLQIAGSDFLSPISVRLLSASRAYTLTVVSVSANAVQVETPNDLPPDLYDLELTNPNGQQIVKPQAFALTSDRQKSADFFDDFGSGLGQWTVAGDWDIVTLDDGSKAATDSPNQPYRSASDGETLRSSITSQSFSLGMDNTPTVSIRHASELLPGDSIALEITSDNGVTWIPLLSQIGTDTRVQAASFDNEWRQVTWQTEILGLSDLDILSDSISVQLRFTLSANDIGSARGWLIDEVIVTDQPLPAEMVPNLFLPLVMP